MRPQHSADDARPTGLMAGATTSSGFSMKIFVEKDQVLPIRIRGVKRVLAMARPFPILVRQEQADEPPNNFVSDFLEVHEIA